MCELRPLAQSFHGGLLHGESALSMRCPSNTFKDQDVLCSWTHVGQRNGRVSERESGATYAKPSESPVWSCRDLSSLLNQLPPEKPATCMSTWGVHVHLELLRVHAHTPHLHRRNHEGRRKAILMEMEYLHGPGTWGRA